mgnify:CR=1 FL=1
MVPNSLGPGELLMHYGTDEQQNYWLPRLSNGQDIPCFALTGPEAGSDAGGIPDVAYVTKGMWEGKEVVGGYLIVKANDLAHAVELSKGCPIYEHEGTTEVRELMEM